MRVKSIFPLLECINNRTSAHGNLCTHTHTHSGIYDATPHTHIYVGNVVKAIKSWVIQRLASQPYKIIFKSVFAIGFSLYPWLPSPSHSCTHTHKRKHKHMSLWATDTIVCTTLATLIWSSLHPIWPTFHKWCHRSKDVACNLLQQTPTQMDDRWREDEEKLECVRKGQPTHTHTHILTVASKINFK